jgi:hypothetical protein
MGGCYLQGCNRDPPWTPGYPGGCPFEGRPSRPRPQPKETLSVSERLRVQQRDAHFRGRAAEAARLAADLARVHEMRDGQQAAERHELCDRAGG